MNVLDKESKSEICIYIFWAGSGEGLRGLRGSK